MDLETLKLLCLPGDVKRFDKCKNILIALLKKPKNEIYYVSMSCVNLWNRLKYDNTLMNEVLEKREKLTVNDIDSVFSYSIFMDLDQTHSFMEVELMFNQDHVPLDHEYFEWMKDFVYDKLDKKRTTRSVYLANYHYDNMYRTDPAYGNYEIFNLFPCKYENEEPNATYHQIERFYPQHHIVKCKFSFSSQPSKTTNELKDKFEHFMMNIYNGNLEHSLNSGSYENIQTDYEFRNEMRPRFTR